MLLLILVRVGRLRARRQILITRTIVLLLTALDVDRAALEVLNSCFVAVLG